MNIRFLSGTAAIAMLLTLGWGCAKQSETPSIPLGGGSSEPEVKGAADELPDGKGPSPYELCVSTEGDVSGVVALSAANATTKNWSQWFTSSPVAVGEANRELCGALNFAIADGDKVYVNGSWNDGTRFLVDNRAPAGAAHDDIKEIWIDDQYYEIGKDCVYQSNGKKGYDLVCTVR